MPALGVPHSEFVLIGILVFALGVVLLAVARVAAARGVARPPRPVVTSVSPESSPLDEGRRIEPMIDPEPAAGDDATPAPRAPTWPALVDSNAGELDVAERSAVLDGLGIVGDGWSAYVLAQAFDQETGALRIAAIEAIAMCSGDLVARMLEFAYASPVLDERYAAVDGASRRADVALLERALRDADSGIALAAAHGLRLARRDDLVVAGLAARGDAESAEIQRALAFPG